MARACPVLGLRLVVVRGVGEDGGWAGKQGHPQGVASPRRLVWGFAIHTPPIWFHFSFPLARNNWPGGWTSVAAGGTSGEGSGLGEGS